jgi:hypothetical protein
MVTQQSGGSRRGRLLTAALLAITGGVVLVGATGRADGVPASAPPGATATIVVTTRALPADSIVQASDVTVASIPAGGSLSAVAHGIADVAGRRLVVGLPAGSPILGALLADARSLDPARRVVRLSMPPENMAPGVGRSSDVEVVASEDGGGGAASASMRRIGVVAVCRVLEVDTGGAAAASSAPASSALRTGEAASTGRGAAEATLDCAAGDALRVLWAVDFAHTLRLVAHPAGPTPPAQAKALP